MSSESSIGHAQKGHENDVVPRMACALCRRRKLRCDRHLPCDSCVRLGFECNYEALKDNPIVRKQNSDKSDRKQVLHRALQGRSLNDSRARGGARRKLQSPSNSEWALEQLTQEEMLQWEQQFFATIHLSIPILHQARYVLGTTSEPRLRPPNYLRHIVCALGASVFCESPLAHSALYRSARKLLEETEYHDTATPTASLAKPEAWLLIAQYEMLQMEFSRWSMSTARAIRLSQMMGLHVVDASRPMQKNVIRAKDLVELEEQRRVFWSGFILDRYASFGQGCPMIIDEKDIHCFLPSSEETYQTSVEGSHVTLEQALTTADPSKLAPFAAAISLTAETGHKLKLLQQNDFSSPSSSPAGDIWNKINFLNDTLHYAFSVPPHLAASGFKHTPMLTFLHMAAPSSTISLHQAAEDMASAHGVTPSSLLESQALRLAAAEMIASTMRLASHVDPRQLHPFTGSCLFQASQVIMRCFQLRIDESRIESLRILLDAMSKLQAVNPLTGGYFKALDREFPGMRQNLFKCDMQETSPSPLNSSQINTVPILQGASTSRSSSSGITPIEETFQNDVDQEYLREQNSMLLQLMAPTTEPTSTPMQSSPSYELSSQPFTTTLWRVPPQNLEAHSFHAITQHQAQLMRSSDTNHGIAQTTESGFEELSPHQQDHHFYSTNKF